MGRIVETTILPTYFGYRGFLEHVKNVIMNERKRKQERNEKNGRNE